MKNRPVGRFFFRFFSQITKERREIMELSSAISVRSGVQDIIAVFDSFHLEEMKLEEKVEFVKRMFNVPILPEEVIHKTGIKRDGNVGAICDIKRLAELVDCRIDLVPIPIMFPTSP